MGGPHNKDFRVKWDTEPGLTSALLNTIYNNPDYRDSLFGTKGDRWAAERDVALEVLKDEPWMTGKEEAGCVKRVGDRWEATPAWTSGMTHPVRNRLNVLAKRMNSDYYEDRFNIDPQWTSESELPEELKKDFYRYIPYYFVLRALTSSSSRVRRQGTAGSASTPAAGADNTPSAATKSASKGKGKAKQDDVKMEVDGEEEEEDLDLAEGAVSGALSDDGSDVLYPEPNSLAPTLDASQAGPSSSTNNAPRVNEGEDELDSQPVVVKKKRGRPIGSTNKKKAEENGVKRGRGRPRKHPLPESETAPKPAKEEVVQKEEEVDELADENDMGPVAASIAHLAAYAAASASRAAAASASDAAPGTAPVSAPKAEPTATTSASITASTSASATVPAAASTSASGSGSVPTDPPVKRKRGRPLGSRTKRPDPALAPSVPAVKRKPGRPLGARDKKPRKSLVARMLSESPPPPAPGAPMCP
ncbi:hypothetical protein IAT38_003623 [Cryptococcus sp. DSM 104549]